jgi:hypothetical protein
MERFSEALSAFLQFQLRTDNWVAYVVFAIASGAIGLAVVLLDCCSVVLGGDSVLNLTHGPKATPKAAFAWTIGSIIGATVGLLARVFQPTPLAAALASLTWRTLIDQLRRLSTHPVQQPPAGE